MAKKKFAFCELLSCAFPVVATKSSHFANFWNEENAGAGFAILARQARIRIIHGIERGYEKRKSLIWIANIIGMMDVLIIAHLISIINLLQNDL